MAVKWYCTEGCADKGACKHPREGDCVFAYDASVGDPKFNWLGEGPPPRRWWANGTLVYRSYADYCD